MIFSCGKPAFCGKPSWFKAGTCGTTLPGVEIKIDHDPTRDKPGEGEVCFRGRHIMMGYMANPDMGKEHVAEIQKKTTDAIDADGWLHTGDAAYLDAEGFIYIVDRWKDMYISGGENVYPAEIENVIYQLPQVGEVAIIGVSDDRWGEVGQAIIVIKPEQTLDEQTVLKHCSDKLAKFKQPQSVRFIDEIPHNATGKVLKRELRLQS